MRSRRRLLLFVLTLFVLSLIPCQPVRALQSKDSQKPKREEFGSSLKNLEWDAQKRMAVEKAIHNEVESEKASAEEVIKLETTLAVFPVLVTDRNGRAVSGLEKENFLVTEDGIAQDVAFFALGDDVARPRSIVLVLEWSNTAHCVEENLKAAEYLISQLGPEDKVAVVTGNLKLVCDFTKDKAEVTARLRALQQKAKRGIRRLPAEQFEFTTLFAVLKELIDEEDEQSIILFQTDSGESIFLRDQINADRPVSPRIKRKIGLADFDAVIERKRATIYPILTWFYCFNKEMSEDEHTRMILQTARLHGYSIRPKDDLKEMIEQDRASSRVMNRLAELSGGSVFCLEVPPVKRNFWGRRKEMPSMDHATSIYSQILSTINQRYVIGYYPTNQTRDGKRRRVQILVRDHPEYTVHSRSHYYDPAQRPIQK